MQSLVFVIDFLLLGMASYYLSQRYIRDAYSATGAATIVIALGILLLDAKQFLAVNLQFILPYLFLEIFVIWLLITESYLKCYLQGHFYIHTRNVLNRFNLGSWAIATALLAIITDKFFPEWKEIICVLGILAIGIWIEYTRIAMNDLLLISLRQLNLSINGSLFLSAISWQMNVLLLNSIFANYFPVQFSLVLWSLGCLLYCWSLVLFIRTLVRHSTNLFNHWSHYNSYIYGGMAITGLAALKIGVIPDNIIVTLCVSALIGFIFIESISIINAIKNRKKEKKYDVAQWAQLFSCGSLYLFTVLLAPFQISFLKNIIHFLTHYGQYLLLVLFLWQIMQFMKYNIKPQQKKNLINTHW